MPSFDIVSEVNMQEVDNAVNQAQKEIAGRYDFKGSKAALEWDKKEIKFSAEDDYKIGAMKQILQSKMVKRGVDILALKYTDLEPTGHQMFKLTCTIQQGIEKEIAKKITTAIRDSKLKVQAQINDDKIKVTSKSIDELQATIQYIKGKSFGVPLQFNNMRS